MAYPGDGDYIRDEKDEKAAVGMSMEEAELVVATKLKRNIEEFMTKLVKGGMLGEVLVLATSMGVLEYIDTKNLEKTEGFVALKILRHEDISMRLGIIGYFEPHIQEVMVKGALADDNETYIDEYEGLNLAILESNDVNTRNASGEKLSKFERRTRAFRRGSLVMVQSSMFSVVMFGAILASSILLCLETPHEAIEGLLTPTTVCLRASRATLVS